jgi:hypothetical protein
MSFADVWENAESVVQDGHSDSRKTGDCPMGNGTSRDRIAAAAVNATSCSLTSRIQLFLWTATIVELEMQRIV